MSTFRLTLDIDIDIWCCHARSSHHIKIRESWLELTEAKLMLKCWSLNHSWCSRWSHDKTTLQSHSILGSVYCVSCWLICVIPGAGEWNIQVWGEHLWFRGGSEQWSRHPWRGEGHHPHRHRHGQVVDGAEVDSVQRAVLQEYCK